MISSSVPCYQQFEKGSCVLGGLSYIDEIKVVSRKKAINDFVGKSACRIELTLKGSCEDKHCVRKLARACSKAGQVMSKWDRLQGRWQNGQLEGEVFVKCGERGGRSPDRSEGIFETR